jgi:hypothetical protein
MSRTWAPPIPPPKAIEAKQADRWHDLQREIRTPLMDQVLALGPNAVPNLTKWKQLLRVAAYLDTHLQRAAASGDLPATHRAYLDGFEGLLSEYLTG